MSDPRDKNHGWVGVDLDGTLAHYDGYKGDDHVGDPVPEMVTRVKLWRSEGKNVRLFTARKPHPAIRRWMKEHLGEILPITNFKDRHMQALYDDRAVQVKRNTGKVRDSDEDQVWNKK